MNKLSERKIVVITKKTRTDELIRQFNNVAQAAFYVKAMGGDFAEYEAEAATYKESVADSYKQLEELARVQIVDREYVPNYIFGDDDIVVVIGQDGLVANTLKYLNGQPLIAVNPDPARYDGILLPFCESDLTQITREVLLGKRKCKEVTMALAKLNDGQSIYAVNDFFIGRKTHVSARYSLNFGGKTENQSSSGIIVSTGLGSTGWLKSIIAGASGIVNTISGGGNHSQIEALPWDSEYLYYSVREPFPSKTTDAQMVFGKISKYAPLKVMSQMPESGVIFSDGVEGDFLQFNSGIEALITIAPKKGRLVI